MEHLTLALEPNQVRALQIVVNFMDLNWEDDLDVFRKTGLTLDEWRELKGKISDLKCDPA